MPSRREECRAKHEAIVRYMDARHLEAVVLTRRCNFAWYTAGGLNHVSTAGEVGAASLLITRDAAVCVTSTIEAPRFGEEELGELGITVRSAAWHDAAEAGRLWAELIRDKLVACDARVAGLPEAVRPLDPDFDGLRWSLTDGEIERYRRLGQEVAGSLEGACRRARPGMTEHQLAGRISAVLLERGLRAPVVLIAADDRVRRYRHPIPTAKKLDRYGMAVVCGEGHGLIVSCTRLFAFGPIQADLRRRHEAVCRVDAAMIAHTRPGRTLGDVFAVAQRVYAETGFGDEWTYHHQGGPTGYVGREVRATPGSTTAVLVNQAFAWNPSIAGTKSEDTILVGPQGNEILSATGTWPTHPYPGDDRQWPRADILVL